ncbi:LysE family translocator [Halopenitus salinus]|uniref:LysE family translocator n=1 Tax=Halopenitus salinus TaxID=1198295 RepID=A0ABD5UNI5_9EURY
MNGPITLLAGVVFGLALAAPPGPMNAIIAEEAAWRGWNAGFKAGLGAASADAVFFVLAYLGVVSVVESLPTLRATMVGVGGVLMLYFAYGAANGVRASFRPGGSRPGSNSSESGGETDGNDAGEGAIAERTGGKGFRKAFVLALSNPYQVLFWLTVGVGLLRPGTLDVLSWVPVVGGDLSGTFVVATGSPALVVGFFAGIGAWITGFPASIVFAERRIERLAPIVAVGSAAVLAGFGVYFLYDAGSFFAGVVG